MNCFGNWNSTDSRNSMSSPNRPSSSASLLPFQSQKVSRARRRVTLKPPGPQLTSVTTSEHPSPLGPDEVPLDPDDAPEDVPEPLDVPDPDDVPLVRLEPPLDPPDEVWLPPELVVELPPDPDVLLPPLDVPLDPEAPLETDEADEPRDPDDRLDAEDPEERPRLDEPPLPETDDDELLGILDADDGPLLTELDPLEFPDDTRLPLDGDDVEELELRLLEADPVELPDELELPDESGEGPLALEELLRELLPELLSDDALEPLED
jgi:hypothetical protein